MLVSSRGGMVGVVGLSGAQDGALGAPAGRHPSMTPSSHSIRCLRPRGSMRHRLNRPAGSTPRSSSRVRLGCVRHVPREAGMRPLHDTELRR
jgi:hypothetical protein